MVTLKVQMLPKQEIEATKQKIAELQDYKSRFWAIGLNGDTLQPDGFLQFFEERGLPFKYFVRSQISVGDESAYDKNIATLKNYIQHVRTPEIDACQSTITELKTYKEKFWAIGLNGDTLQPDGFIVFFGVRNLPFKYFVRVQGVSLGEQSAYDENIATLETYIQSL
jgi:hypothetical protein